MLTDTNEVHATVSAATDIDPSTPRCYLPTSALTTWCMSLCTMQHHVLVHEPTSANLIDSAAIGNKSL